MLRCHLPPISHNLCLAELVHCLLATALCWHGILYNRCPVLKHCLANSHALGAIVLCEKCNAQLKSCLLWIRCHSVLGPCFWFHSCSPFLWRGILSISIHFFTPNVWKRKQLLGLMHRDIGDSQLLIHESLFPLQKIVSLEIAHKEYRSFLLSSSRILI